MVTTNRDTPGGIRRLGARIRRTQTGRIMRRALAAVVLAVLAVAFAIYPDLVRASGEERAPSEAPSALKGPFTENFTFSDPPVPAPSVAFESLYGVPLDLGEFKGEVVLVNFWATWCAPCVREMPGLERLHQALKDEGFLVAAVSEDRGGADKVVPFLDRLGLKELPVFLDQKGALARAFSVRGLPATFLIDRNGGIVAGLTGPAEWDSPEAIALIRHYLRSDPSPDAGVSNTSG
ncbi:TlpA family protein disulfide reductase [Pelagibius litoralis]|uniref:TlpA family protein disulfide reductase n=1 Tax=Pelagibius litoralis TaxID=374515 RepID=A0A967C4T7_9PROT|nr:TlpA disulfide reductase family protein [Pelagibius litoralis]NIA68430.1 TlpA family protein disulfide reductase [Pelagibius litoralis]